MMSTLTTKSYKKAIVLAQAELSAPEKFLSKLIHSRILWRVGEYGEFFLRPIPLLIGYSAALICGILFIVIALIFNYSIKSLHVLFFIFAVGYLVGVIVGYLRLLLRRQS